MARIQRRIRTVKVTELPMFAAQIHFIKLDGN